MPIDVNTLADSLLAEDRAVTDSLMADRGMPSGQAQAAPLFGASQVGVPPVADDRAPSNPISALGSGIYQGVTRTMPEMAGQAANYVGNRLGFGSVGQPIVDWANKSPEKPPTDWTNEQFYSAGKSIVPSVGAGPGLYALGKAISMIPHPYAKVAGTGLSMASKFLAPILFGASQAGQTMESAQKTGVPAGIAPELTGAAEGLGEYFGTKYLGRLFGIGASGAKPTLKTFGKEMLQRTLPVELGTEFGQQGVEASIEKMFGIRPDAKPLQEAVSTLAPTALMTLLTGGAGHVAQTLTNAGGPSPQDEAANRIRVALQQMFPAPTPPFEPGPGAMQPGSVFTPPTTAETNQSLIDILGLSGRIANPMTQPAPPTITSTPWQPEPTPPAITAEGVQPGGVNYPDANQSLIHGLSRLDPGILPFDIANRADPVLPEQMRSARNQRQIEQIFPGEQPTVPSLTERNQGMINGQFPSKPVAPVVTPPVDLTPMVRPPAEEVLKATQDAQGLSRPADVFAALQSNLQDHAPTMQMSTEGLHVQPRDYAEENFLISDVGARPSADGQSLVIPTEHFNTAETFNKLNEVFGRTPEENADRATAEQDAVVSQQATRDTLVNTLTEFRANKRMKATSDEFRSMVHQSFPDLAKSMFVPAPSKAFQKANAGQVLPADQMQQLALFPNGAPKAKTPQVAPQVPVATPASTAPTKAFNYGSAPRTEILGAGDKVKGKTIVPKMYSKEMKARQDSSSQYLGPMKAVDGFTPAEIKQVAKYQPEAQLTVNPENLAKGESWHRGDKFVHQADISKFYDGNADTDQLWSRANAIHAKNPGVNLRTVFAGLVRRAGHGGYILNVNDKGTERWAFGFTPVPVEKVTPSAEFNPRGHLNEENTTPQGNPKIETVGLPGGDGPNPDQPDNQTPEVFAKKAGLRYDGAFVGPKDTKYNQYTDLQNKSSFLQTPDESFQQFADRVIPGRYTETASPVLAEGITLQDAMRKAGEVFAKLDTPEPDVKFERTQEITERIQKALPEGISIKAVENMQGLPDSAQKSIKRFEQGTVFFGWFEPSDRTVYIVNSALENENQIYETAAHELIGHLGLSEVLGPDYAMTMMNVYKGLSREQLAKTEPVYRHNLSTDLGKMNAAEEYVAYVSESGDNPSLLKTVIAAIRKMLRAIGLPVRWSDNDIRVNLLAKSGQYILPGAKGELFGLKSIGEGLFTAQPINSLDNEIMLITSDVGKMSAAAPPIAQDYMVNGKLLPQLKDLPQNHDVMKLWSAVSALVRSHLDPKRSYLGLNKSMVEDLLSNTPSLKSDTQAAWNTLQSFYADNLMSTRKVKIEVVDTSPEEKLARFMAKTTKDSPLKDNEFYKSFLLPHMQEMQRQVNAAGPKGIQAWIQNHRPTVVGDLKVAKQKVAAILNEVASEPKQEGPVTLEQVKDWRAQVVRNQDITKRFKEAVRAYKEIYIAAIREQDIKAEPRPTGRQDYLVNGKKPPDVSKSDSQAVHVTWGKIERVMSLIAGKDQGNRRLAQLSVQKVLKNAGKGQLGTFKPGQTGSTLMELNTLREWFYGNFGHIDWRNPKPLKSVDVKMVESQPGAPMAKRAPTDVTSLNPDVEARWSTAYETQGNLFERMTTWLRDTGSDIVAQTTRHFKDLNPKTDGEVIDIMRQQETIPSIAKERAGEYLKRIQKALGNDPENARLYERIVILNDLVREATSGKLVDSESLPFGYKNVAEVQGDLDKFNKLSDSNAEVKAALKQRDEYFKRLVDLAKQHKVLNENATDKNYFHHQVSLYQALQGNYIGGPKELRKTTKSFQRKRTGSIDDYNTNYFTAEHDVVSGLISQIETAMTVESLQNAKANKLNDMLAQAKSEGLTPKEAIRKFYPDHRLFNTERNPLLRRRLTLADQDVRATQELAGVVETEFADPSTIDELTARAQVGDILLVPNNVADALENFHLNTTKRDNVLSQFSADTLKLWKQWVLFNPLRVVRYSFNNATGDADVVFAYRPTIITKYMGPAARDLFKWNYQTVSTDTPLWKELGSWRRKGLLDSGITINEIPNLSESRIVNALMNPDQAFIGRYFTSVKKFNNYRENILRLATARYMFDQMNAGKEDALAYASSRPEEVKAIPKAIDRSAKMARELVGDYGNVSYLGQRISKYIIPFWSWMEINAPRYIRMMRNEIKYGGGSAGRITMMSAWSVAKLTAKMTAFASLIALWNATMFPDEDDEFRRVGRDQLHLILGRNEDGSIRSVRMQGAFSDLMSWVGLEHTPQAIDNIVSGQKSLDDVFKEAFKAPVKRLVSGAVPLLKGPFEAAVGKTMFPEPFNPRPIRDKWQHLARSFGLQVPYNMLSGKPSTPGPLDDLKKVFLYETDPGEASYYWAVGKVNDYLKDLGQQKAGGEPTPKSNALFYYKQSVRMKDLNGQKKYLQQYMDIAKKDKMKGIKQSLKAGDPRVMVPIKLRHTFLNTLTEDDKKTWKAAVEWHKKNQTETRRAASASDETED